jgi:hypothetical protein
MSTSRLLRPEEATLITSMLGTSPKGNELLPLIPECLVEEMQDGNMGSLKFVTSESRHRRFGEKIAEAEFVDEDGVLVSATINLDDRGNLFELDLWKVDFSPLKRYPRAEDLDVEPRRAK